ncbi:hypothetical protein KL919_003119 [Ogataea angusta]|nr:hypothetical protein KL919_003119 [Ogataea angusta]
MGKITRSRKGCFTCKQRRRKCDETKPSCLNCVNSGRKCAGYGLRLVFDVDDSRNEKGKVSTDAKGQPKYGFRGRPRINNGDLKLAVKNSTSSEPETVQSVEPAAQPKPESQPWPFSPNVHFDDLRAGAPAAAVPSPAAGAAAGPAAAADQRAAVCERERRVPVLPGQRADFEPVGRQLHSQAFLRQDDISAGRAAVGSLAGADAAVWQSGTGQVVLPVAELDPSVCEQRQQQILQEGHTAHQQHDGVPDQVRADQGHVAAAAERGGRRGRAAERGQHRDEPEERERGPEAGQFFRDPAAAVRAPALCNSRERPVCSVADFSQAVQHHSERPAVQVCAEPHRPVADADLHSVVVRHGLGAGVARLPRAVLQPRVVRHEARRGLHRAHERLSRRDLPGVCRHLPPAPPPAQPHDLRRRGGRRARRAAAAARQLPRLRAAGAGGLVCVRGAAQSGAVLGDLGADQAARDVRARPARAGRDREPDAGVHPHVRNAPHDVADRHADGVARVQHRAALQKRELATQAAAVRPDAVQDRQHGHDQDGDAADRRGVRDGVQGGGDSADEGVAGVGHRLSAVLV